VNGQTVKAYLCQTDIIVVDGSGRDSTGAAVGGLYLVDPGSGNQTLISSAGYLGQASSVTIEPGTGKLIAVSRTYGVIRVDPKDGSQEVLMKGGTGWGSSFPTFSDAAHNNATEMFIYPAGVTIDPVDSSILVTDTGINLYTKQLNSTPPGAPNCTDTNNVRTCEALGGKIVRIRKAQGQPAGTYNLTAPEVVAKGGLISEPFDLAAVTGGSLYITDMNAKLGGTNDPGSGGIIFLNSTNSYAQSSFFSSYSVNANSLGCPMGITIDGSGNVLASVFSYNGYGCAPAGVFILTPDLFGGGPPTFNGIISGSPFQYPFGMDTDLGDGNGGPPRIIVADEGSGYGCKGTIFRLDLSKPIVRVGDPGWTLSTLNPFALSPIVGQGCNPPNQTYLVTPSDAAVVKATVPANIATNTPPGNVTVIMSPSVIDENGSTSVSGSFTDPDSGDTHTVTITWGDGSANTVLNLAAGVVTIPATSHQYLDNLASNAPYTVSVNVADAKASAAGTTTVTVNNAAPVITGVSGPSGAIAVGGVASIGANFTDVGTLDTHTCTFNFGDGSANTTVTPAGTGNGSCSANHTYNSPGTFTVGVTVTDKDGGSASNSTLKVTVNTPPAVASLGVSPSAIVENGSTTLSGTFTDPDANDTHVVTINWGDGSPNTTVSLGAGALTFSQSHQYLDNNPGSTPPNTYFISVSVADSFGASAGGSTSITVTNANPVITGVTGPTTPSIVGSVTTIKANFTDAGTLDTHTCNIKWGDTTTSAGTVAETSGSGSCTQTHTYADDGVYSVDVTVTDNSGGATTSTFRYVVIYDPSEATLTGSGSFNSPAGADAYDTSVAGPATFGFSVKYNNNTIDPTSYKQFDFTEGNLHFSSSSLDWFVASGPNAQFHGYGSMNSDGRNWTFLATVTDGQLPGGGGTDKYRVKFIDDTGLVVYDNVRGAPDDIDLANAEPISSGQITIFYNTPPAVSSLGLDSTTINEGGTVTLSGTFTDPDAGQKHTVYVDWGDNTTGATVSVAAGSSNFSTSHKYKDNPAGAPTFTIGVRVVDSMGATGTGNASVTVNNVAPVLSGVTGPTTVVNTGASATLKGTFTDVGVVDTHSCVVDWGDGQTTSATASETNGSGTCTVSHVYGAGGPQTATFTLKDKDGGSASSTVNFTVNSAPVLSSVAASPTAINEGKTSTVSGSFTDADSADTHTITIVWGDGTANTTVSLAAGVLNFSSTHTYRDNPAGTASGSYNIGVTVADNHNGKATGSSSVTVSNVAPVIGTITKPNPAVILGSAASLKIAFSDAGTLDTHTCSLALGDGTTSSGTVTETNGSGSCALSYTYAAAGTYSVTGTITDKDGASVSSTFAVVVDTVPTISTLGLASTTINENDVATLSGTFTDPDAGDTHKITINWGDGSASTTVNLAAGVLNFSPTHRYLDNPAGSPSGSFTINVTVADNMSGSVTGQTSITVNNLAPVLNVPSNAVYGNSPGMTQTPWTPFTDKGTLDAPHTCTYDYGDGKSDTFTAVSDSGGSGVCSASHTFPASGTYTLTITVVDKDGGTTGPKTFPLVVP
jgi:hypothetical protein